MCTDAYDRAPVDSLNESQLAAGRDLLLGAGRHRCGQSQQQALKEQRGCVSIGSASPCQVSGHETA
jgi:hypothetical protein